MQGSKFLYFMLVLLTGFLVSCQQKGKDSQPSGQKEPADTISIRIAELTELLSKNPGNAMLLNERSALYNKKENYNEALKDALTVIEIDSTTSDYYITLADAYLGLGKLQPSLQNLFRATELDAGNVKALVKLAEIHIIFRDYKMAVEYIDKVMKLDELEPKAYFLRGVVLLENADTVKAILNFQKAVDVNQDYFEAHLQLGMLYAGKKNKLAVDYFNNALNIQPDNLDVAYYLALFYQESGNYEQAIKMYEELLVKEPSYYYALYNIGYINLVYLNDYPKAVEYFTKVIELKPEFTDAWYNRGFAWEMLKNVENSRNDYLKALELTPNYQRAVDGMNRIEEYLTN